MKRYFYFKILVQSKYKYRYFCHEKKRKWAAELGDKEKKEETKEREYFMFVWFGKKI